ncbi:unnamed protein product [Plutella xylostella]|uniref:(diamondback moth) hypothetical protein n=1 Tax=Plutella xylostella TaxID=51655 RepID=A0A8S4EG44_PLUXY|nr:unnamed protein product [Plutella xylostella]
MATVPPAAGFTQRATLDPHCDDMFVLSVSTYSARAYRNSVNMATVPPAAGFTQRATLDPHCDDMFVLSVSTYSARAYRNSVNMATVPPAAGFTQRATLDPHCDDMFVLSVSTYSARAYRNSVNMATVPPAAGFTQRATLDPHCDDMFVLSVSTYSARAYRNSVNMATVPPAAGFTQRATLDPHCDDMFVLSVSTYSARAYRNSVNMATVPPAAGFTQRATLDPHCDDMFVLSGMSKEKDKRVHNALWVFSLRRLTWSCLYRSERARAREPRPRFAHQLVLDVNRKRHYNPEALVKYKRVHNALWVFSLRRLTWLCLYRSERARAREPRPRFAHQLVLDVNRKVHYLFGGNPGNEGAPRLRLDDLWALELVRPSLASIAVAMRVSVREACYRSLCASRDPRRAARALPYLRRRLHSVLDHSDEKQVQHFQKLPTLLFAGPQTSEFSARALSPAAARRLARRKARTAGDNGLELSRSLAAVLGADDTVPELPEPFEELEEPTPDTWDVGDTGSDDSDDDTASCARAARVQLYDKLCQYFRPSVVPPQADITDLVTL